MTAADLTAHAAATAAELAGPPVQPPAEYDRVLVRVSYELEVPVPTAYRGDPSTAELHVQDLLNRLPTSDHDQWYVLDSEHTTYEAEAAR